MVALILAVRVLRAVRDHTLITLEVINPGFVQRVGPGGEWNRQGKTTEVARLAGIEPTTLGFGGQYSIH